MAYVETWDETKPAGSRDANLGDDDIREFKRGITERLRGGGMYFPTTDDASAGQFNSVKYIEQSGNPTSAANTGHTFTKDSGGVTELYYMDSAGTVVQMTVNGKIPITSLYVASEARGDVITRGASAWQRLGIGASGTFLKSDGTDPSWATPGFQTAATQAEMEAASSDVVPVTPTKVKHHPNVAKAWALFNGATAGTNAPTVGSGVTSIERTGTGLYTINWATAFSSANYALIGSCVDGEFRIISLSAGSANIQTLFTRASGDGAVDATIISFAAFGDQA